MCGRDPSGQSCLGTTHSAAGFMDGSRVSFDVGYHSMHWQHEYFFMLGSGYCSGCEWLPNFFPQRLSLYFADDIIALTKEGKPLVEYRLLFFP